MSGTVESPSIFARFKPLLPQLFRFPKIKIGTKGDHYAVIEDFKKLKAFPISDFTRAMKRLEDCAECIRVSGDYFEWILLIWIFCIFFTMFAVLLQNLPDTLCMKQKHSNINIYCSHPKIATILRYVASVAWCLVYPWHESDIQDMSIGDPWQKNSLKMTFYFNMWYVLGTMA